MEQQELNKIKGLVEEFFDKISFEAEVKLEPTLTDTLSIRVKTDEPKILIGQGGQTLAEIQRLLRAVVKKQVQGGFYLDLDINDYKAKKIGYLTGVANSAADEAVFSGREKALEPMTAYERRIIHLELAKRKDISAFSEGEEPERKIVIRPYI